jgi:predicted CoA-substrate-specific enzyme activase
MKKLGIDIGSLYLGAVLLEDGQVRHHFYREHKGNLQAEIAALLSSPQFSAYDQIGVTGNWPKLGQQVSDSMLSTMEGTRFLLPQSRNIFVIGGETFSLIFLDAEGKYREHTINSPCASGTGSFLEQQAERLHLSVSELATRALQYAGKTPLIATRCAVFAKTDITHAMQEGYSLDAICAGLCEGIARNVLDVLVKGRELIAPIGIVGGVSRNAKIVAAIANTTGKTVVAPQFSHLAGAIGAALLGKSERLDVTSLFSGRHSRHAIREQLAVKLSHCPDWNAFTLENSDDVEIMLPKTKTAVAGGVFLGIDIGSTSTKAVIVNQQKEIAGGFYTKTAGEPVAAVQRLIEAIKQNWHGTLSLCGAGTTGSGRKMTQEIFRADMEINEITAHAKAAVFLHPQVDTIIEIGGQDAKFTKVRGGEVYYSTMNYVCAAGTGSFIEEQARRLQVSLAEFSDMALRDQAPYTSDRCTVYMERDLCALLSEGWSKEALAAAVLYSVRDNYLAKVVNKTPLGDYLVFQGATARNTALVAAFEQFVGKPVHVSPYCHLTGALGVALLCLEAGMTHSSFLWNIGEARLANEECKLCANRCLLTVVTREDVKSAWGMKCGRDYAEHKPAFALRQEDIAPLKRFHEAMAPLYDVWSDNTSRSAIRIGLAQSLYNIEYESLWYNFLRRLGFTVELSKQQRKSLAEGQAIVNSDFCAPMILAHGYIKQLLESGVPYLFYPAVVNAKEKETTESHLYKNKMSDAYFCYYSQYLPTLAGKLKALEVQSKLISPLIYFREKSIYTIAGDIYKELANFFPDLMQEEVTEAFQEAYDSYTAACKKWQESFPMSAPASAKDKPLRVVLMGRPYVVFDPVLSLSIPKQLEEMGVEIYWQDEFSVDEFSLTYANKFLERMHWHYGKRVIKLAEFAARTDNLFVVYLTAFRCSPDAFLISYLKDIMAHFDKPFLILQLDAHGSDVGYTTRIEAGIQSFRNYRQKGTVTPEESLVTHARNDKLEAGDTVLVFSLDRIISQFWCDCFTRAGYRAMLLDNNEAALSTGYQYASGGECMPLVAIVGSVIELVRKEKLNPATTYFYMPTQCLACNFPQFTVFADMAFNLAGMVGIKIALINSMSMGSMLSQSLSIKMLESYIVGCIFYKLYNRIKPYEITKGDSDAALGKAKARMSSAILQNGEWDASFKEAVQVFRDIARDESKGRKPRIGLVGDLYVKYNDVVNQKIQELVSELGGELVTPSMTEYPFHFYDADVRLYGDNPRSYKILRSLEQRYEKVASDLIADQLEPDAGECVALIEKYGIKHYLVGETAMNVGRALYYASKKSVDAIIHLNPMFCCPGVVTASIYRKIQEDFQLPIIDIFYDGTGNPNRVLIPHMHYLRERRGTG